MNRNLALIAIMISIAGIALIAHLSTTTLEYSRYNRGWNGTTDIFVQLAARNAQDLVDYDDLSGRNDTLLIILAPAESFSDREIVTLRYFLDRNNTLFIADETGTSNSLFVYIGENIRVKPVSIQSMQREFAEFSSVIAYTRKTDPLLANVTSLTLNQPSEVTGGDILVNTSFLSWKGTSGNQTSTVNASFFSSYGVLTREQVGNSTIYVLSDPSVFVNGMHEVRLSSDNDIFIQNLLSLNDNIIVEQSNSLTGKADPLHYAVNLVKKTTFIEMFLLFSIVLFVAIVFRYFDHRKEN